MNIKLSPRIALTTERAESSYGIPILVIDGAAFGPGDDYQIAFAAASMGGDWYDILYTMYTGKQLLLSACRMHSGIEGEAVNAYHAFVDIA